MTWQRIVQLRIQQPGKRILQRDQVTLQGIIGMQMSRNNFCFHGINDRAATYNVDPCLQRGKIASHPVRRHHGVRIGCQQNAI